MGWGGRGTHAAPRRLWGEPASCAAWRPRVIRASAHSWGAATPESTVGGAGKHLLGSGTLESLCLPGLCEAGPVLSWDCGGASGVACWVLVAGRAGRGGGRRRGESHPSQARRVGGCVLSCEALSADGAAVMLLQPGHNTAVVEQVVARQLPHALAQPVVVLAHGALQPGAYVLLGDRDGGEGLDFLFVCGRGARVFKLIEELKDKRPEGRSSVGGRGPLPRLALKCKAGLPAKAPRTCLSCSPDPPYGDQRSVTPRGPATGSCPLFCLSSQCHLEARAGGRCPVDSRALPQGQGSHPGAYVVP